MNPATAGSDDPLPYRDIKPVGAAGFYIGINAAARFIKSRLGYGKLVEYWETLGRSYYRPVTLRWQKGGFPVVAAYWRAFFAAEPGAVVRIEESSDSVTVHVDRCPLIHHLREQGREILPELCRHCYHVNEAIACEAGMSARVCGGNGACRQTFTARAVTAPQQLDEIHPCL